MLFSYHVHFLVDDKRFDITCIFFFSFLCMQALKKLVSQRWKRSVKAKTTSSLDAFWNYMAPLTWWSIIKDYFNGWLMTQKLDPLILFEAERLAKAFVSLLLDTFISYTCVCTKTSSSSLLWCLGGSMPLVRCGCGWELYSLEEVRKGWHSQAYHC